MGEEHQFSKRSRDNLAGVHPDLQKLAHEALRVTTVDFVVIEGLRTYERQVELFQKGATTTLNSRHLTGHAIDIVPWIPGAGIRWDWPLFYKLNDAFSLASSNLSVPYEWGGNWTTFKDGPHFQLPWSEYSAEAAAA